VTITASKYLKLCLDNILFLLALDIHTSQLGEVAGDLINLSELPLEFFFLLVKKLEILYASLLELVLHFRNQYLPLSVS
jgi:hypothetical protein